MRLQPSDEERIAKIEARLGVTPGRNQGLESRLRVVEQLQAIEDEADKYPRVNRPEPSRARH